MTGEDPELPDGAEGGIGPSASVAGSLSFTLSTSACLLVVNLCTGVLTARLLLPDGRGVVAAIAALAQTLAWVSSLGFNEAVTYLQARRPAEGQRIMGTALLGAALLGTVGVVAGELLVGMLFGNQPDEVAHLARAYLPSIYLLALGATLAGVVAGDQGFRLLNLLRLVQPLLYLAALLALWGAGSFTPGTVLVASAGATAASVAYTVWHLSRTVGVGRPSLALLREGLAYGRRLIGWLLGFLGTARLDLLVMPAVLSTTQIGLYSVAVAVTAPVMTVLGSARLVVFPAAARREGGQALELIGRTLRLVLVAGAAFAALLTTVAPALVSAVYGDAFAGSVVPLRLLLPGVVLMAGASIVSGGLQALNRPGRASYAQLAGLVVTVAGLWLTLPRLGIVGAALTSATAYAVAFGVALWFLGREEGVSVRSLLAPRAVAADLAALPATVSALRGRRGQR